MIKNSYKSVIVLFSICLVVAAILAAVNFITAPIIEESEKKAAADALRVVCPEGDDFEPFSQSLDFDVPTTIKNIYVVSAGENKIGLVFEISEKGYAPNLNIMCGINSDGVITGIKCLSSGETLGYEKAYGESFVGKGREEVSDVDTISGATLTTTAFKNAIMTVEKTFNLIWSEVVE